MSPIHLRVREVREARGLTQTALAAKAGVDRGALINIEKGRTTGVDFDVLDRLATALGVDAALLIAHTKGKR